MNDVKLGVFEQLSKSLNTLLGTAIRFSLAGFLCFSVCPQGLFHNRICHFVASFWHFSVFSFACTTAMILTELHHARTRLQYWMKSVESSYWQQLSAEQCRWCHADLPKNWGLCSAPNLPGASRNTEQNGDLPSWGKQSLPWMVFNRYLKSQKALLPFSQQKLCWRAKGVAPSGRTISSIQQQTVIFGHTRY